MIYCAQCRREVEAARVLGTEVISYKQSSLKEVLICQLKEAVFCQCPACGSAVACKPGTNEPRGPIVTDAIRKAQDALGALISPLWASGKVDKSAIYARFSTALGRPYDHFAPRSLDECRRLYRVGLDMKKENGL